MLRRSLLATVSALAFLAPSAEIFGQPMSGIVPAPPPNTDTIQTLYSNGQVFVWIPGASLSAPQTTDVWTLYVSASRITNANVGSATVVNPRILPQSAALVGGNPDATPLTNGGGVPLTLANQVSASAGMTVLPTQGSALAAGSVMGIYTVKPGDGALYFALQLGSATIVPGTNATTVSASGAVATPAPYIQRLGSSRIAGGSASYAPVASGHPLAVQFPPAPNTSIQGATNDSAYGDYWAYNGPPAASFADGVQRCFSVYRYSPSVGLVAPEYNQLEVTGTQWAPDFSAPETYWYCGAFMKNPPRDPSAGAARFYRTDFNAFQAMAEFAATEYGSDVNNIFGYGDCLGVGTYLQGIYNPSFYSCIFMALAGTNIGDWPSVGTEFQVGGSLYAPGTLPSPVYCDDGVTLFNGSTGWSNGAYIITSLGNTAKVPAFFIGVNNGDNVMKVPFADFIAFAAAMLANNQFFVGAWSTANHAGSFTPLFGAYTSTYYFYTSAPLNRALPCFANNSVDDDPNSAASGAINMGFSWTITADTSSTLTFSIGNAWMDLTNTQPSSNPPNGPGTPATSATVDVKFRRIQNFNPATGTTVFVRYTAHGGSQVQTTVLWDQTTGMSQSFPDIVAMAYNSGGPTVGSLALV